MKGLGANPKRDFQVEEVDLHRAYGRGFYSMCEGNTTFFCMSSGLTPGSPEYVDTLNTMMSIHMIVLGDEYLFSLESLQVDIPPGRITMSLKDYIYKQLANQEEVIYAEILTVR